MVMRLIGADSENGQMAPVVEYRIGELIAASPDLVARPTKEQGDTYYAPAAAGPRYSFSGALADSTVLATFATGHGWTISQAGAGTAAEDTSRRGPFSDRSIAITQGSSATATQIQKTLPAPLAVTDGPISVWFRFPDGQANPQGFELRLGDSSLSNGYAWSVYPNTPTTQNVDGWTALELYPKAAITLGTPGSLTTMRIRPYANTTVSIGAIAQKKNSTLYPNGVITLRFDDGYDSQYNLAVPSLAKYGYPGTLVVIADRVDIAGGISLAQLKEMRQRAGWEVGPHSFTTAAHDARFTTLTTSQVRAEFFALKGWLQRNGFDSSVWASPGGQSNAAVWEVARQFFAAQWGVSGGLADAQLGGVKNNPRPVYPAHIPSVSYDSSAANVAAMQAVIADVAANKTWGTLTFHAIAPAITASGGNMINVTDLETLLSAIQTAGIAVQTPNQVLARANV